MKTLLLLTSLCFSLLTSPLFGGDEFIVIRYGDPYYPDKGETPPPFRSMKVLDIFYLQGKDAPNVTGYKFDALDRQKEHDRVLGRGRIPISDEARGHFVMGTTLFRGHYYSRAQEEFAKAAELAPGWPEPHYNLALVFEAEANSEVMKLHTTSYIRDNCMNAILHFKIYLDMHRMFGDSPTGENLSSDARRELEDKIYRLKAKAQMTEDYKGENDDLGIVGHH